MIIKRLAAAKGEGRRKFFGLDNLLATIFMIGVLSFALAQGITYSHTSVWVLSSPGQVK